MLRLSVISHSGTIPETEGAIKKKQIQKLMLAGLKKSGLRLTPQRRTIVDILTRDLSHPSAKSIFNASRDVHPKISLSTVYATLVLLKNLCLVKELEFEGMDNRYDMDTENHVNLICTNCGRIDDFTGFTPPVKREVEDGTGFSIHDGRFEYYGLCRACRS